MKPVCKSETMSYYLKIKSPYNPFIIHLYSWQGCALHALSYFCFLYISSLEELQYSVNQMCFTLLQKMQIYIMKTYFTWF